MNNNEYLIATTKDICLITNICGFVLEKLGKSGGQVATSRDANDTLSTLFIGPIGCMDSKHSDKHHKLINDVIEYIDALNNREARSLVNWVKVSFGERGQKILAGNNNNKISAGDYHENYHVKNVD